MVAMIKVGTKSIGETAATIIMIPNKAKNICNKKI